MVKTAATLGRLARRGKRRRPGKPHLPSLWFVTDPFRTPDPRGVIARLPRGAGVIYRAFGAPDAEAVVMRLRRLTAQRGLVLLIGADERLAARVGADGVHLPERNFRQAARLRRRRPQWLITAAAHSPAAVARAAVAGVDAVLLSAIFPSHSPSAGRPMGVLRLAQICRQTDVAIIALGGVNDLTAPRLVGAGVWGVAAVGGFGSQGGEL